VVLVGELDVRIHDRRAFDVRNQGVGNLRRAPGVCRNARRDDPRHVQLGDPSVRAREEGEVVDPRHAVGTVAEQQRGAARVELATEHGRVGALGPPDDDEAEGRCRARERCLVAPDRDDFAALRQA